MKPNRIVTLLTDFGTDDTYVAQMKGAMLSVAPDLRFEDVTHAGAPQDVAEGAWLLRTACRAFPPGTVHLCVVDPGVGTARRAICIETPSARFVGPDNGLLSLAAPPVDVRRVVEITNERHLLSPRSRTFHGRDVFAPAAAALAAGIPPSELGPDVDGLVRLAVPAPVRDGGVLRGQVVYADGFGNLATNIDAASLPATVARVEIGARRIDGVVATYGAVATGELLALVNSWGVLEVARRDGDARTVLGVDVGAVVTVVVG
jgi:S-adenosylmethionine hydrolase